MECLAAGGYEIVESSELVLTVKKDYEISLYSSGRMLVFSAGDADAAERAAESLLAILRKREGCVKDE